MTIRRGRNAVATAGAALTAGAGLAGTGLAGTGLAGAGLAIIGLPLGDGARRLGDSHEKQPASGSDTDSPARKPAKWRRSTCLA
jgi:hypothetical protein